MNNLNNPNKLERVDKRVARRLFDEGMTIQLLPCKVGHGSMWIISPYFTSKANIQDDTTTFDSLVDNFEYYNCCNEIGRYAAYYVQY